MATPPLRARSTRCDFLRRAGLTASAGFTLASRPGWLGSVSAQALGIKQVETRLLRWRPEYRKR